MAANQRLAASGMQGLRGRCPLGESIAGAVILGTTAACIAHDCFIYRITEIRDTNTIRFQVLTVH